MHLPAAQAQNGSARDGSLGDLGKNTRRNSSGIVVHAEGIGVGDGVVRTTSAKRLVTITASLRANIPTSWVVVFGSAPELSAGQRASIASPYLPPPQLKRVIKCQTRRLEKGRLQIEDWVEMNTWG
jgi:hypothetical protein